MKTRSILAPYMNSIVWIALNSFYAPNKIGQIEEQLLHFLRKYGRNNGNKISKKGTLCVPHSLLCDIDVDQHKQIQGKHV